MFNFFKKMVKNKPKQNNPLLGQIFTPALAVDWSCCDHGGWFMSEKLDGVRAIWNGEQLVSRNGKVFKAPDWFIDKLPTNVVLDGELFFNRDNFDECLTKVRSSDWTGLSFRVFELLGLYTSFAERYTELCKLQLPSHVSVVEQTLCNDEADLLAFEKDILSRNGEGVILRDPTAFSCFGRTNTFQKIKRFQSDEAIVVDYLFNKSLIKSLIVEFMGKRFKLSAGLTVQEKVSPPAINDLITFKFFGLTKNGIPRHASFVANRNYE